MSETGLILFLTASLVVIVAPGPDNILVLTRGVKQGRGAALAGIVAARRNGQNTTENSEGKGHLLLGDECVFHALSLAKSSSAREPPPHALPEPYVNLSIYTALIVQPLQWV